MSAGQHAQGKGSMRLLTPAEQFLPGHQGILLAAKCCDWTRQGLLLCIVIRFIDGEARLVASN